MKLNPKVIDIYHGDDVLDFAAIKAAGYLGVIHKATQGIATTDPAYAARRKLATEAGLMWGAYHFNTGDTVSAQVEHFMLAAQPDANTLMALDFEDNTASEMTLAEAVEFLRLLDAKLGRRAWLYSGNRIKESIVTADRDSVAFLAQHKFWLCEYGPAPKMMDAGDRRHKAKPLPWAAPTLWQFTGDGVGPAPHTVNGIKGNVDINHFDVTDEELAAQWSGS